MNSAYAPNELAESNPDTSSIRKACSQNRQRGLVRGIGKRGPQRATVCQSRGRGRVVVSARMLSKSPSYRDRLPRANLGTRRISLPYPATTSHLISVVALCERRTHDAGDLRPPLQVSISR